MKMHNQGTHALQRLFILKDLKLVTREVNVILRR